MENVRPRPARTLCAARTAIASMDSRTREVGRSDTSTISFAAVAVEPSDFTRVRGAPSAPVGASLAVAVTPADGRMSAPLPDRSASCSSRTFAKTSSASAAGAVERAEAGSTAEDFAGVRFRFAGAPDVVAPGFFFRGGILRRLMGASR